jgi:hypothetical protein
MAQTDLVCSKCVGRRTANNIMIKVNIKVMVTSVPPDQPLAYTRRPIFVSASVPSLQQLCISSNGTSRPGKLAKTHLKNNDVCSSVEYYII